MAKDKTKGTRPTSDPKLVNTGRRRTSADKRSGPSTATRAVKSAANPQRPFAKANEVGGKSKKKTTRRR